MAKKYGPSETMIAEQLQDALQRKGWSITAAAQASGLDRPFLSRLLNGQAPPRSRDGRRTAEHDQRYRQLATALELEDPDGFIKLVVEAQKGAPNALPIPTILRERYPELEQQITKNQPLRHKADLLRLLDDCLAAILPAGQTKELAEDVRSRLKASAPPPFKTQFSSHDYLGLRSNPHLPAIVNQRAQTCQSIGNALVEVGKGKNGNGPSIQLVDASVRIAMLFHDLVIIKPF